MQVLRSNSFECESDKNEFQSSPQKPTHSPGAFMSRLVCTHVVSCFIYFSHFQHNLRQLNKRYKLFVERCKHNFHRPEFIRCTSTRRRASCKLYAHAEESRLLALQHASISCQPASIY